MIAIEEEAITYEVVCSHHPEVKVSRNEVAVHRGLFRRASFLRYRPAWIVSKEIS